MSAAIILCVVVLAIIGGSLWLRWADKQPDGFDYCDVAASEPMPIEPERRRVRGISS